MARMSAIIAATMASAVVAGFRRYPLYKQCNSTWGSETMGVQGNGERATICREGCAMSSLSMALGGLGFSIGGQVADPHTLNQWLIANQGYTCIDGDCNNLVLDAVTRLVPLITLIGEDPKPSVDVIQKGLLAGDTLYLAHVHNSGHFVLLTGYDPTVADTFWTNDPLYNSTTYPYANISDIIMYKYASSSSPSTFKTMRTPLQQLRRSKVAVANSQGVQYVPRSSLTTVDGPKPINLSALDDASAYGLSHASASVGSPVIPFKYPLYKQCDSRWGNTLMQTETICAVGCLMSSTSMAIGGKNITIGRSVSDPATLNSFLQTHNGYAGDNDMDESVVPEVDPTHISWPADGMHRTNDIPLATIQGYLKAGRPIIANVMKGQHFVLVIGWDAAKPDTLYVNDPGFSTLTYSYSTDVVGWRLFDMS